MSKQRGSRGKTCEPGPLRTLPQYALQQGWEKSVCPIAVFGCYQYLECLQKVAKKSLKKIVCQVRHVCAFTCNNSHYFQADSVDKRNRRFMLSSSLLFD